MRKAVIRQHIEAYLGPIAQAWKTGADNKEAQFEVVRCVGGVEETQVFCTLGLSAFPLVREPNRRGGPIRQELLIALPDVSEFRTAAAVLQQLGDIAIRKEKAFLRGEVIGGSHVVFPGLPFRGFYASVPTFIESDDFASLKLDDDEECVFAWMIPVFREEIDCVNQRGWNQFEDLLAEYNVDMIQLDRPPLKC